MQEKNGSRKVADYIKRIFSSVFGRKNVCGLDSCNMPETVNDYSRLYKKYKNDEEQEKRLRKKVIGNGAGKRADANYYFRLYLRPDDIKKCIKMCCLF